MQLDLCSAVQAVGGPDHPAFMWLCNPRSQNTTHRTVQQKLQAHRYKVGGKGSGQRRQQQLTMRRSSSGGLGMMTGALGTSAPVKAVAKMSIGVPFSRLSSSCTEHYTWLQLLLHCKEHARQQHF